MTDFRSETAAAIAAVRTALELARQGTGQVHAKVGRDVVTDTDVAVEDHLRHVLTASLAWPVIGEERGGQVPEDTPYWVVDPICGAPSTLGARSLVCTANERFHRDVIERLRTNDFR